MCGCVYQGFSASLPDSEDWLAQTVAPCQTNQSFYASSVDVKKADAVGWCCTEENELRHNDRTGLKPSGKMRACHTLPASLFFWAPTLLWAVKVKTNTPPPVYDMCQCFM